MGLLFEDQVAEQLGFIPIVGGNRLAMFGRAIFRRIFGGLFGRVN